MGSLRRRCRYTCQVAELPVEVGERSSGLRHETLLAAFVVVIGAVVIGLWTRDAWFTADYWDHLAMREIGDLENLLRPHRGHWQTPAVVQTRFLYAIAGMDYWPIHHLPRLFWWSTYSFFAWRIMRWRGADPFIALGALVIMVFLSIPKYFSGAHVGALISAAVLLAAGMLVEARERPSNRDLLAMFGLAMLGVASSGLGAAVLAGLVFMALFSGRSRRWVLPLGVVSGGYLIWALSFGVIGDQASNGQRSLLAIPGAVLTVFRSAIDGVTGFDPSIGWVLLALAFGGLGWLVWRRRLTPFDMAVLVAALAYATLIALARGNILKDAAATNLCLILFPMAISHVSLPSYPRGRLVATRIVAAGIIGFLAISNMVRLQDALDVRWGRVGTRDRPVVERMAILIGEGESYLGSLMATDLTSSSQMDLDGLAGLVADGWHPERPVATTDTQIKKQRKVEEEALVRLRVSWTGTVDQGDRAVVIGRPVGEGGCVDALPGESIVLAVTGETTVKVRTKERAKLVVTWSDDQISAQGQISGSKGTFRGLNIYGPGPDGATVTLQSNKDDSGIRVCRVRAEETIGG